MLYEVITRLKASSLGIDISELNQTLAVALGSAYVNDFIRDGRVLRVVMQVDAPARATPEGLMSLRVRTAKGTLVPLSDIATPRWVTGLPKEDAELVAWLVAEHLTLSQTAQKQDLSDPDVIAAFAQRCGDVRHLTALYLLTISDIRGTSPMVWNAWKDKLTQELYLASRRLLEKGGDLELV